jgi:polar amino acid transport system substrate-binding protein
MVPAAIAAKGVISVAVDPTYAPNEFIAPNSNRIVGWDVDLGHALGAVMGVRFDFQNVTFDSIIPGLQSAKYGIGMASFADTRAREKVLDFVTYFSSGSSFYVKASGGVSISGLSGICGHKVAVQNGTTELADVTAQGKRCQANGEPPVTILTYPTQNDANLALSAGRAEAVDADSVVAAYAVKQTNGRFKLSGKSYGVTPYGIAVPKDSGMAKPILAALRHVMADGTYMRILKHWGVQYGAISHPVINGAIS